MTLTIELTPEEEARLAAAAENEQLEPAAFIRKWVNRLPAQPLLHSAPSQQAFDALLAQYHSLLDKKFTQGLTGDEAGNLSRLADEISALELADPVTQDSETLAQADHAHKVATLDQVIQLLRSVTP